VQTFAMTGEAKRPLRAPRRDSIASFGTHDLAPFAAFWTDEDLALRQRIGLVSADAAAGMKASRGTGKRAVWQHLRQRGLIDEGAAEMETYRGTASLLAESRARWVALSLEDTWGETRPQNVPGTLETQHPNWRRRAKYGLDQFDQLDDITNIVDVMRSVRGGEAKEQQNAGKG
jgi:4-alpha-glucanotransferase